MQKGESLERRKPKKGLNGGVTKKAKLKLIIVFVPEKLKWETKQLSLKLQLNERKTFSYY